MVTLRSLYEMIPKKYRKPVVHWVLPFIFGLIIIVIWDVAILLVTLFLLFIVFYLFYVFGSYKAREVGRWSITEYFKRIRGMIIFALLPTALEIIWELIREISLESIIALCVLGIVALSIWERFDKIIEDITRQLFGKRWRRRR